MVTVNVHEARTQFSKLLARVMSGEEVIIARSGEPVAVLSRYGDAPDRRVPGNDSGLISIGPDFHEPLPELET